MQCLYKKGNIYDIFAIKSCQEVEVQQQIVGTLSIETSRFTNILVDRGAVVPVILYRTHCHGFSLVKKGLEGSCAVEAKLIVNRK